MKHFLIGIPLLLTSCSVGIYNVDTHGAAQDVIDYAQTTDTHAAAEVKPK